MEFDDLVTCPWCTNQHEIVKKRLEIHFSKLKQNRDPCVKNLKSCRYNVHHKFLKKDEDKHYAECADAQEWSVREVLHQKTFEDRMKEPSARQPDDFYEECDEGSWDNECEKLKKFDYEAFRVPENYHSVYEEKQSTAPYSAPKEKVTETSGSINAVQAKEDQAVSDDRKVIRKLEKKLKKIKKLEETAEREETKASLTKEEVTETNGSINALQTKEDQDVSDDRKVIRKLEKKLKEIKKLEEKAEREETKAPLTKEEREKISKRKDIEKQLAELKGN